MKESVLDLIRGIYNRKLYKAAVIVPFEGWPKEDYEGVIISKLRENAEALASQIAKRVKSNHHVLIYVPPLKTRAKGLDTRALFPSGQDILIKLGDHPDLVEKVREINEDFRRLWKLLVFLHPDEYNDWRLKSKIADLVFDMLEAQGVRLL